MPGAGGGSFHASPGRSGSDRPGESRFPLNGPQPHGVGVLARMLLVSLALLAPVSAAEAREHLPATSAVAPAAQTPGLYSSMVNASNRLGVTLTNYGAIGNNFSGPGPSFEYPLGSGYEHLTCGGLWVGANAQDAAGAFTGVTTGYVDAPVNVAPLQFTEFTPGDGFMLGSNEPNNPSYSPGAISSLDAVALFSDVPSRVAYGGGEPHRSLGIEVRQTSLSWDWPDLEDVLFLRYTIRATAGPLSDVWVGLLTDLASGNRHSYACWPPTLGCSPIGSWYSKKWLVWDASQRLLREHYCVGVPVPSGCQLARVPPWAGVTLLTPPGAGQRLTLAAWNYGPGNTTRDEDVERYALMSAGTVQDISPALFPPGYSDPLEMIALGPFGSLVPGDSIVVTFALVAGDDVPGIQAHAASAQDFFDAGFGGPTATQVSLVDARADAAGVHLVWQLETRAASVEIERRESASGWRTLTGARPDDADRVALDDARVVPGARYGYRLVVNGAALGEVWVDVPAAPGLRLEPARPTPAGAGVTLVGSQPAPGRVHLAVFDAAGRRVATLIDGVLPAGRFDASWDGLDSSGRPSASGVYVARLVTTRGSLTRRIVLAR